MGESSRNLSFGERRLEPGASSLENEHPAQDRYESDQLHHRRDVRTDEDRRKGKQSSTDAEDARFDTKGSSEGEVAEEVQCDASAERGSERSRKS